MKITMVSIDWTDKGCDMSIQGATLKCPACGAVVTNETHQCGDKAPKLKATKHRRLKASS